MAEVLLRLTKGGAGWLTAAGVQAAGRSPPTAPPVVARLHLQRVAAGVVDQLASATDKPLAEGARLLPPADRVRQPAQPYGQVIGEHCQLPEQGVGPRLINQGRPGPQLVFDRSDPVFTFPAVPVEPVQGHRRLLQGAAITGLVVDIVGEQQAIAANFGQGANGDKRPRALPAGTLVVKLAVLRGGLAGNPLPVLAGQQLPQVLQFHFHQVVPAGGFNGGQKPPAEESAIGPDHVIAIPLG